MIDSDKMRDEINRIESDIQTYHVVAKICRCIGKGDTYLKTLQLSKSELESVLNLPILRSLFIKLEKEIESKSQ